ncbi:hypothetical protein JW979_11360, partial [bacterium]|nr:hypothetical protein [candidate division CSSED10-310 bacterium]
MRRTFRFSNLVSGLLLYFVAFPSIGSAFFSFGARSSGMGGAFSAAGDDASSVFWNPATVAILRKWSVDITAGREWITAKNMQSTLTKITESDPRFLPADTLSDLPGQLEKLSDYSWISNGGERFGFTAAHSNFAFTVMSYDLFYLQPEIDTYNTGLDPNSLNPISNNSSMIAFTGFQVMEYGITYAWLSPARSMAVGMTGKYANVTGYHRTENIWDIDVSNTWDLLDSVKEGASLDESVWSFDAGLIFFAEYGRLSI